MPVKDQYGKGFGLSELTTRYPERQPSQDELNFFGLDNSVAGYAAPDKSVVLNPHFKGLQESVLLNERLRHLFSDYPELVPQTMTILNHQIPSQQYADNPQMNRETILARLLSGDPSGSPYSWQQQEVALQILNFLQAQK